MKKLLLIELIGLGTHPYVLCGTNPEEMKFHRRLSLLVERNFATVEPSIDDGRRLDMFRITEKGRRELRRHRKERL